MRTKNLFKLSLTEELLKGHTQVVGCYPHTKKTQNCCALWYFERGCECSPSVNRIQSLSLSLRLGINSIARWGLLQGFLRAQRQPSQEARKLAVMRAEDIRARAACAAERWAIAVEAAIPEDEHCSLPYCFISSGGLCTWTRCPGLLKVSQNHAVSLESVACCIYRTL